MKSINKPKLNFKGNSGLPESVNFHFLNACNMKCSFCFAGFESIRKSLSLSDQIQIVRLLGQNFRKITFVGGEPTLSRALPELIATAKQKGAITCLVTNGSQLTVGSIRDLPLDWITLSIDSGNTETHRQLGRTVNGNSLKLDHYIKLAQAVHKCGKHLKVNTVVNRINATEDMSEFIRELAPERWKIFQVLPIQGENDAGIMSLLITENEFHKYVQRHKAALNGSEIVILSEDNQLMTGSYAMVDPLGRFFDNVDGFQQYGRQILDVGLTRAWKDIRFCSERFIERGGDDYFKRNP